MQCNGRWRKMAQWGPGKKKALKEGREGFLKKSKGNLMECSLQEISQEVRI